MKKTVKYLQLDVVKIFKSQYNAANIVTAELRQEVITTTYYPRHKISNSLQDNIFLESDFIIEDVPYENTEVRVAWLDVPKGTTAEDMEFKLLGFHDARIYKILSNYPILTEEEELYISEHSDLTKNDIANKQAVRHSEKSNTPFKLILDKYGKIQYRRLAFSSKLTEDQDNRNASFSDMYLTPELKAELNGKVFIPNGQEL